MRRDVLGAAETFSSTNNAKGTVRDASPVNVQTTNATVTTLDSFTLATGTAVYVSWLVTAVRSTLAEAKGFTVAGVFRNNGGTVTQEGASSTPLGTPAWTAVTDFSGTQIRLRVTGAASTTIQWTAVMTRLEVIP
jgi:hypothetical protein